VSVVDTVQCLCIALNRQQSLDNDIRLLRHIVVDGIEYRDHIVSIRYIDSMDTMLSTDIVVHIHEYCIVSFLDRDLHNDNFRLMVALPVFHRFEIELPVPHHNLDHILTMDTMHPICNNAAHCTSPVLVPVHSNPPMVDHQMINNFLNVPLCQVRIVPNRETIRTIQSKQHMAVHYRTMSLH